MFPPVKMLSALLAAIFVWIGAPSIAVAQDFAPLSITVAPSSVETGGNFTVAVAGLRCGGAAVRLTITPNDGESRQPRELQVIPRENVEVATAGPFTAPSPGSYTVRAAFVTEEECGVSAVASLTVVAATTTSTTTSTTTPPTTIAAAIAPATAAPTTTATTTTTPTPSAAVLPATGQSTDGVVWLALAALLGGLGLVTLAARRS